MAQPTPQGNLNFPAPGSLRSAAGVTAGWEKSQTPTGIRLTVGGHRDPEIRIGDVVILKAGGVTPYLVVSRIGDRFICRNFSFYSGSGKYRDHRDFSYRAELLTVIKNPVHLTQIEKGKAAIAKESKRMGKGSKLKLADGSYGILVEAYSSSDGCFGVEVDGEVRRVPIGGFNSS